MSEDKKEFDVILAFSMSETLLAVAKQLQRELKKGMGEELAQHEHLKEQTDGTEGDSA